MKKLILLMMACPTILFAGDNWWIRPFNKNEGTLNIGNSYENAWNGLYAFQTNGGQDSLKDGDTLRIVGYHDREGGGIKATGRTEIVFKNLKRVVVSGKNPYGDDGVIQYSEQTFVPNHWVLDASGKFYTTYMSRGTKIANMYELQETGEIKILKLYDIKPMVFELGTYYFELETKLIYYRPFDGVVDDELTYKVGTSSNPAIRLWQCFDIVVEDLIIRGATHSRGNFKITNSKFITVQRCNISVGKMGLVLIESNLCTIVNNEFSELANGIYAISGNNQDNTSDENYVAYNYFHDMDQNHYWGNIDHHCIGWQAGAYNIFEYNIMENIAGEGILLYCYSQTFVEYNTIRYNVINRVWNSAGASTGGIEMNGDNDIKGFKHKGNKIYGNVIANVIPSKGGSDDDGLGIRLKSRQDENGNSTMECYNNFIINVQTGVFWRSAPALYEPGFDFYNNTVINASRYNIQIQGNNKDYSAVLIDLNLYDDDKPKKFKGEYFE